MAVLALGLLLLQPLPPPEPVPPGLHDLVVSFYNPELGGINCSNPPDGCSTFGSGVAIQRHHYGRVAACPVSWRGRTVEIHGVGSWSCVDSGGAVVMHWTEEDGLHAHLDILSDVPLVARGPWPPQEWELR